MRLLWHYLGTQVCRELAAVKPSRQDSKGGRCAEETLGLWCVWEEKKGLLLEPVSTLGAPMQLWEQVTTCPPGHWGIPPLPRIQVPS